MTEDRLREKRLFEQLVEIDDPAGRAAFLDQIGGEDAGLRGRLEELLGLMEPAETLLVPVPGPGADPESYADERLEAARVSIGRYLLLRRLGAGGCGVVYLAEQQEPVRRRVALKIIRLGMHTESVIARFERERQALAIMDHPCIARVLDAGTTELGRPYFVMEWVEGIKITDYCTRHRLTTEERLLLFVQVCQALQHAHQKGIIHRDIKPSNILVAAQDGRPAPKVIDFGIAKAIGGAGLAEADGLTRHFHLVGTPAYMSPEQADLGNPDLDTRSDIYSLGVLLHELLTGRTPFSSRELEAGGWEAMRQIIHEREPARVSAVLAGLPPDELRAVAEARRTEPARLLSAVRGDLDWIVATTLEKDRRRRYETAHGLAMDIRRHLANEPVVARPPGRMYRLRKLVRRNRVVFIAGGLVLLSLLAGLGASTWLLLREREAVRVQARLLEQAEAREKIAQAAVKLSYGKIEEADQLVATMPDALFRPSLECAQVLRTLGEWHAVAGRWEASARCHFALARVIMRVDPSDSDKVSFSLIAAGAALREQGDLARYESFRRDAVTRFADTTNSQPAEQVLKASLLAPVAPELLARMAPLAELVAAAVRDSDPRTSADPYLDAWRCFVLALHAYRLGDMEAMLRWTERAEAFDNPNPARHVSLNALRALAHIHAGRPEEARALLEADRVAIDAFFAAPLAATPTPQGWVFWFDWVNARLLRREAEVRLR